MDLYNIIKLLRNFQENPPDQKSIDEAANTLQKILDLKIELRQRFDPDKLNELYLLIEGRR